MRSRRITRRRAAPGLLAAGLATAPGAGAAEARDLRIGLAAEATSIDPHFHNVGPNNSLRRHIFEGLVTTDAEQRLVPVLAVSWTARDATTWEFKLRPDATFSDGTPFT